MKNKFVVFILSHGRADSVTTYKTLQEYGFTGEVKIICDNEDKQIDKYIKNFGDNVIVFDKKFIAMNCDSADNFDQRLVRKYRTTLQRFWKEHMFTRPCGDFNGPE